MIKIGGLNEFKKEFKKVEIKGSREMTVDEFGMLLEGLINEIEGSGAPIDCHKEG